MTRFQWPEAGTILCVGAMTALITLPIALMAGTTARAADGKTIVLNGAGNAPACAACHGPNGEGQPDAGYPRLAGLSAAYIVEQLKSFDTGTRKNDIMAPVAKALSPSDRQAVADYLSRQTPPATSQHEPLDNKLIAAGEKIAADGDWSKGLPGCNQCHGPAGSGVGAAFPRLAGQSADYITNQLAAWKTGERSNDPLHLMTGVAEKLGDDEVKAVAAYYASLDPIHPEEVSAQGETK